MVAQGSPISDAETQLLRLQLLGCLVRFLPLTNAESPQLDDDDKWLRQTNMKIMKLQSEYWHVKRCKINITKYHKHEVNWNNLRTLASTICDVRRQMSGDGLNVALQYTFVVKDIPGHATGKGSSSITPWWRHETVEIVLLDLLGSLKHSFSSSDPHPETLF